jgi:subtilisin family serine protease
LRRVSTVALENSGPYRYPSSGGSDVWSYIIDTGVYTAHNEFATGRATWGWTYPGGTNADCNGHGTHVAGTVAGVLYGIAKNANVVAVKVLDCNGSGAMADIIAGIKWVQTQCAGYKCNANMSLGGSKYAALNDAVDALSRSGVPVIVAAGNSNLNACNYSPSSAPDAICVGAMTSTDARSSFSNFGTCVNVFAPGTGIKSAWIGGVNAVNTISGTSMASPHVAGRVSILQREHPNENSSQIKNRIINEATNGILTSVGTGSPNKLLHQRC